jgi:GTP-binding protein
LTSFAGLFHSARFVTSVAEPEQLNDAAVALLPEVAFVGRSNAGKSTAINVLTDQRRLAFSSKTPGRTQLINFFDVEPGRRLVDLPGYGYAAVPERERRRWGEVVAAYLAGRHSLVGLVAIMDVRHPLTPLDEQLLDWFLPAQKPVHILLTKADKLSRNEAAKQLAGVRKSLGLRPGEHSVQLFSSLDRQGVDEARDKLAGWLGLEPKETFPAKGELGQG